MTLNLPTAIYHTKYGKAFLGDALDLLQCLPDDSVDLIFTSPPFPLQRPKAYGNEEQDKYVNWLLEFAPAIKRILKETGSFVLDIGGAYQKDKPIRSLHNYKVLIRFCEDFDFKLAEEFFWYNPCKLPSPTEWVNKRKIRVKDAVHTIWWLSKTDFPKADVTKVRVPYSTRMKQLLESPEKHYKITKRPSGHDITDKFMKDNGGAIPSNLLKIVDDDENSNLLEIANTNSHSNYLKLCKEVGLKGHPARFPEKLPEFFIKLLTSPGDLVVDIFAGSNTTGHAAEGLGRKWIAFEKDPKYIAASVFWFLEPEYSDRAADIYQQLLTENPIDLSVPQSRLPLM